MTLQHHYVDFDDVRLHYVDAGDGPLMLFVHGFPEFWYAWQNQIEAFSRDYRAVALDLRVTFSEAADDADRAVALFDQLLQAPAAIFTAGRTITVRGVLVPRGDGTWWIKPRNGSDLTLGS